MAHVVSAGCTARESIPARPRVKVFAVVVVVAAVQGPPKFGTAELFWPNFLLCSTITRSNIEHYRYRVESESQVWSPSFTKTAFCFKNL